MQTLSDELLIPPTPLVALLSDAPFLDALAASLRSFGGGGTFRIRYETSPLSTARFPAKQRTHGEHEYASYVPAGILRSNWLEKHHNLLPAVLVRPRPSPPARARAPLPP